MKKIFGLFAIIFISKNVVSFASVDVGLELSIFSAFSTFEGNIKYNSIKSKFSFTSPLSDDVSLFSSLIARYNGDFQNVSNISSLFNVNSANPGELYIDETYIKIQKFLLENIDIIFGKQRINWGKADKINPTDILNPFDMFDVLDFNSKFSSLALNTKVYFNLLDESYLQLVLEPTSGIARLNSYVTKFIEDRLKDQILESLNSLPNVSYNAIPVSSLVPLDNNISNGIVGIKLASKFWGFDTSFSFAIRKNDIPYVSSVSVSNNIGITVNVVPPQTNTNSVEVSYVNYSLSYHGEKMIGFDVSKDLGFLLTWLEIGVFIPEEAKVNQTAISKVTIIVNSPISTNTNYVYQVSNYSDTYLKEIYTKYIFGFDKTFEDGLYLNFQFAHGLGFERGFKEEHLQDYIIVNIEKKFFDDMLKLRAYGIINLDEPFSKLSSTDPWNELINNSGLLVGFEISYSPVIGANLGIRVIGIDGNGSAALSRFKDFDIVGMFFEMQMQ